MTKGTGWQKLAEIFLPVGKLSWIYPTAAEWAPQALKTVGQGHSPGWLVHEPLIWGQQNIGKFDFKKIHFELKISSNNGRPYSYGLASVEKVQKR